MFEVHISNPAAREAFRTTNYVAPCAEACIAGFGARGYLMALDAALEK
ncbi:MAG: type II 3-dehydroquinate dehydratase [Pseudomonadota bacterium]|nr:type II 3-dehydroquinate dehydratase [Pseudomonadota bacterium]